ncbi:lantibiotic dehydratase C-terminal domain-containing protein [Halobacillus sp. H74]|uniref:lantibiotic dehydratase C-terminal domain-containing protein n=1 Tax=Halobacillus sp. H74 TaxID=3457436 RepID=UPI003FCE03B6
MWNTLNLYYHGSDKNKVIINEIDPIIQYLKSENLIEGFYFVRHWVKGPHLRLNFKCDSTLFNHQVIPIVSGKLEKFLKHYPSEDIKEVDVHTHYKELAKMELITEDIFPFEDNNSIKTSTYETHTLLGKQGLFVKEKYCTETYGLIVELLRRSNERKDQLFNDLMHIMILCISTVDDMRFTYLSFRSHSESMLHGFDKNNRLRDRFENQYNKNQKLIMSIIKRIERKELNDEFFVKWVNHFNQFHSLVKKLVENKEIKPPMPEDTENFYRENGFPKNWVTKDMSNFHNMLYSRKSFDSVINSDIFNTLRIMLNVLYVTFGQVGIKPLERYYLCYLVANGVEDFFNINWKQQIKSAYGD